VAAALWSVVAASCGRVGFSAPESGENGDSDGPVASLPAQLTLAATCGDASPAAAQLEVANVGTAPLVIESASLSGGFALATALPVVISPGAQATLSVRPPMAVVGTDIGGDVITGSLSLATNESGGAALVVTLASTVHGANVELVGNGSDTLAFDANGQCPSAQTLVLSNTGDEVIAIAVGTATAVSYTPLTASELAPAGSASQSLTVVTNNACSGTASITYVLTGSACTASPVVIEATFDITNDASCHCMSGPSP
jgi:hypothetical protein